MATKKITDLQLIAAVTSGLSVPGDNGTQTYRFTASQMKDFILANQNILLAMLKDDIFHGLTGVSLADDDYLILNDTSDSNKVKKALASAFARNNYTLITNPSDTAITTSDVSIKITGTTGAVVLPTAVGIAGKRFKIIHAGSNFVQYPIKTTSSQTVGGIASAAFILCTAGEVLEVESNGANYEIFGRQSRHAFTDLGVIPLPTASSGSPAKANNVLHDKHWFSRDGDLGRFRYVFRNNTSTPSSSAGTGPYRWPLPTGVVLASGVSVDTTTTDINNAPWRAWGAGGLSHDSNTHIQYMQVVPYSTTAFRILISNNAGTTGYIGGGLYDFTLTDMGWQVDFTLPIADWRP